MFSKKKSDAASKDKSQAKADVKIALDTLETESVASQLREIEEKKKNKKDPKSS
jgi:hypothetical protein